MSTENITKLAVFEGKHIRKVLHHGEWWFAVIDVVEVLTDSVNPKGYIKDMRRGTSRLHQ
jgi:prophage antirepressor-like protein